LKSTAQKAILTFWIAGSLLFAVKVCSAGSGWAEFKNREHGFAFDHPAHWQVQTDAFSDIAAVSNLPLLRYDRLTGQGVELRVYVLHNENNRPLSAFFTGGRHGATAFIRRHTCEHNGLDALQVGYAYEPAAWGRVRYEIRTMVALSPAQNVYLQLAATAQIPRAEVEATAGRINSSFHGI
jgi:hypothetical protein